MAIAVEDRRPLTSVEVEAAAEERYLRAMGGVVGGAPGALQKAVLPVVLALQSMVVVVQTKYCDGSEAKVVEAVPMTASGHLVFWEEVGVEPPKLDNLHASCAGLWMHGVEEGEPRLFGLGEDVLGVHEHLGKAGVPQI